MSVAEQLRQTPRGRLKYDRHRVCLQSIEAVLEEIHADMDSLQVRLVSPAARSPPSFGLRPSGESDSDGDQVDTPLHRPVARMTGRGPWSADRQPPEGSAPGGSGGRGEGLESGDSVRRNIQQSFERSPERSTERGKERGQERSRSQERSQERSRERSTDRSQGRSAAGEEPRTSTPRAEGAPTPFTPRAFDKLLQDERRRHLEEAKAAARARLAAAEETVRQLRAEHERRQLQLAATERLQQLQRAEQRSLQRQRSEQQLLRQQADIRQQQQREAQGLSERVQAAVQQQRAEEEERRQRAARQRAALDRMVAAQKQMRSTVAHVFTSIKGCADRPQLQAGPAAGQLERLKQLVAAMDRLAAAPPDQLGVSEAEEAATAAAELASQVTAAVDEINAAAERETKETHPAKEPAAPAPAPAAPATASDQPPPDASRGHQLQPVTPEEDRSRYEQLQQSADQFRQQFAALLADPALKKFKFDCQKAVNTPINAISPVSTAHLRDKLEKLRQLLRGQPVTVTGGQVSAASHPHGVQFCLDLVAKKFVRQGEDVVSSKPEAAFALAAVLRALQQEFPVLSELTAAHCLARCPYLAPLYPPQLDGDTDEQYYRRLGYDYVDGVVEKQDKFLKRMSGIARLYVALLIARPPQAAAAPASEGAGGAAPLGVRHLWRWLAAVVNTEPRADVTASLLLDALEVGGSTLSALYGGQLVKLVKLISAQYLPRIQQVTPAGCGGPVVRLEQLLRRIISAGTAPPPQGELRLYNW